MSRAVQISLIIPVYNVETYIEACMDSIRMQDLSTCEVILVDDGSKDKSVTIIERYLQAHPQLAWQLVHKPNGGLSSARNYGLQFAHGDYVWFIDSDDLLAQEAVGWLKTAIRKQPVDAIVFNYERFKEMPINQPLSDATIESVYASGEDYLSAIFSRRRESYAWSFIAKRLLYLDHHIDFPEGRNYEDMATTYQIAYFSQRVLISEAKLYLYRDREGSISNRISEQHARDLFANLTDCQEFFNQYHSDAYGHSFGDFAAYYALLAYQQSYSTAMMAKLKAVYKQLTYQTLSRRYQVAYVLARMHLLRPVQYLRARLSHSSE